MADPSDTDSQSDDDSSSSSQEDVEFRQLELDAILATKLSWKSSNKTLLPLQDASAVDLANGPSEKPMTEDDLATTAFPLFRANNHVRLLSPSLIYTGPGRGRILEEAEEPKSVRKERKKRILECAVDADWILERSKTAYWAPHPHDARKLATRTLAPHRSLPKTVLGLLKPGSAPTQASSPQAATSFKSVDPHKTKKEPQRVKITPYPDTQKVRLAKKVMKQKFVVTRQSKRKSKKRRDFENAGKGKQLPGLEIKTT